MSDESDWAMRRVVTGLGPDARSMIVFDGPPTRTVSWHPATVPPGISIVWGFDDAARATRHMDQTGAITTFFPPPGGTRFLIEHFDPGYGVDAEKSLLMRKALDRAGLRIAMATDEAGGVHATATVDYGIVVSGRIRLLTDTSEVTLQAGDAVVQTGVRHAWRNDFDQPCVMAFVLVGIDQS
jgi:mannose-6-phosphate isomerase-like protein (cupin superfamily)